MVAGSSTVLNDDIWEQIVDLFGQEIEASGKQWSTTEIEALKALSLTCKAMVPLCRRHLLSSLDLNKGEKYSTKFNNLINENPQLLHYIRHLTYWAHSGTDIHVQAILTMLRERSTALRSLELELGEWTSLPNSLQTSLERLIQLPSVSKLQLSYTTEVPLTIFARANLTHITLHNVDFAVENAPGPEPTQTVITCRPVFLHAEDETIKSLMDARVPGNEDQKVVDFSGLRDMEFVISSEEDAEAVWQLLQTTSEAQSLDLDALDPFSYAGLGASLSVCACSTLRRLDMSHEADDQDGEDMLRDISNELKVIAGKNVLEEISLWLAGPFSSADLEACSEFDVLVTTSGLFPKLKSVSLDVECYDDTADEEDSSAHHGINTGLFPRLSKSGAIEFRLSWTMHDEFMLHERIEGRWQDNSQSGRMLESESKASVAGDREWREGARDKGRRYSL